MSESESKIILILGAAFAGIPLTHKLLRTLPAEFQVVLVNPSTHMFWNVGAPRALAKENTFGEDNQKVWSPIVDAFALQPPSRFRFVQGLASALDPTANTCTVSLVNDDAPTGTGEIETITYEQVVIATGSSASENWPFKQNIPHTAHKKAVKEVNEKVATATTIVISGAGATGVETTGEIATFYPGKKIYLLSASDNLLTITKRPDIGLTAVKTLTQLGVNVKTGVKVVSESDKDGHTELVLSNGDRIQADLHIPTYGLVPNTAFVPKEMLDEKGWVKVDEYTRVVGYENVWACGDVATVVNRQAVNASNMAVTTYANLSALANGKGEELKPYKEGPLLIIVPMGGKFAKGTGQLFGWKVWGVLAWALKGRSYMVDNFVGAASGKTMVGGQKV